MDDSVDIFKTSPLIVVGGTQINSSTLKVFQQDPDTLSIPNTTKTVKEVNQILKDETTTNTANLITIEVTITPAQTNPDLDNDGDGILNDADTGTNADSVSCALLRDCDGDGVFDATDADPTNPDVRFNFAPIFTSEAPIQATEDQLYSYQVVFADDDGVNDTIVFSQSTYPAWLTLNGSTK